MKTKPSVLFLLFLIVCDGRAFGAASERRLSEWLKRFPDAGANRDGRLAADEAEAYRRKRQKSLAQPGRSGRGAPRHFEVDPGWRADRFPNHAISYRSPELIHGDIEFGGSPDYPSRELDRVFRKIAWQAAVNHPLSGVTDEDRNGIGDDHE